MKTAIAISVDAIVDDLLAQTALRHYVDRNDPPLLTRDRKPALERAIRGVIASMAVEIGAALITDVEPSDVIILELELPATVSAGALRGLMQQAVGASVTVTAYAGVDQNVVRRHEKLFATALDCIRSCIAAVARITPWNI